MLAKLLTNCWHSFSIFQRWDLFGTWLLSPSNKNSVKFSIIICTLTPSVDILSAAEDIRSFESCLVQRKFVVRYGKWYLPGARESKWKAVQVPLLNTNLYAVVVSRPTFNQIVPFLIQNSLTRLSKKKTFDAHIVQLCALVAFQCISPTLTAFYYNLFLWFLVL